MRRMYDMDNIINVKRLYMYKMKQHLKYYFEKLLTRVNTNLDYQQTAMETLKPESVKGNSISGYALIAYIPIEPLLFNGSENIPNSHTYYQELRLMAQVFLNMGYQVDVISGINTSFNPPKKYDFFIAARMNFERIAKKLTDDCIKIVHLDMAHWIVNNLSAYERCWDIQKRRGVTLPLTSKLGEFNLAIECADYATILGNKFTYDTYKYAGKTIFRLPLPTCTIYPWLPDKNFNRVKRNYIWLGSKGFIHKGLDLTLEAFSGMPNYHLYVCGPIEKEKAFVREYYKELYETPNIHTIGWVDVESSKFEELRNKSLGIVYPSCSEGGGGSVITCMQAGLIPVVSYESSVDIDPSFGILLPGTDIESIRNSIKSLSNMSEKQLYSMAKNAWEIARHQYTKEAYVVAWENVISQILQGKNLQ
jgi:glycosyltransferase involved in cell wall biosynthesis